LVGLLVAISVNLITGEGQPALVYLVPVTLGVVAYTAVNRGESNRILEFVDERDSLL
jgi:minor histocompatibility antigen H13